MPRSDRHNEIEVNFLQSGTLSYLLAGSRVDVKPARWTAFWACVPHRIVDFEGVGEFYVLTVPLTWFLQWRLGEPLTKALLHGEVVAEPNGSRAEADCRSFAEWCDDLSSGSRDRRRVCALEVEARWRRLALDCAAFRTSHWPVMGADQPAGLSSAEQMASFIAKNYLGPLDVKTIAGEAGLHPNYAMTIFRKAFGSTLVQHITQHRLHHAQRLLATSEIPAVDVASLSGFGSVSRFYMSFREAYGCTPREFRRALRLSAVSGRE